MMFDIDGAEEGIKYSFKDKMLLRKCFAHSSYGHENDCEDNEKLEFFGDAILDFVITEYLYKNKYGDEGDLTEARAKMVSRLPLVKIVHKLKIDRYILFGKGLQLNQKSDEKLYSSLYEAIVAGIYIDGGLEKAKKFINETLIKDFEFQKKKKSTTVQKDYKTQLQEFVQKLKIGSISYDTLGKKGPDHMPEFRVAVLLNGSRIAEGKGKSIKDAGMNGAQKALKKLKQDGKVN